MTTQLIPYTIFVIYNALTYFAFLYGPFHWPIKNDGAITFFMISNLALYTAGYVLGSKLVLGRAVSFYWVRANLNVILIFGIVIFAVSIFVYTGKYPWDVTRILNDQSQNYYETLSYVQNNRSPLRSVLVLFKVILQPGVTLVLIYATLNFKSLSVAGKMLLFSQYAFWALFSVFRGTDKEIFDILVTLLVAIAINYFRNQIDGISLHSIFRSGAILFAVVAMVIVFFSIFSQRKMERMNGNTQVCFEEIGVCSREPTGPLGLGYTYSIVTSYAAQGYHGLDMAFGENFEPTYMLGGSAALIPTVNSLFGTAFLEKTYVNKIDRKGWDSRVRWATAYTWWASDVSFYLIPFLIFLLAVATALSWREAISAKSDLAATVFSFMTTITIFLSANNQIALTIDSLVAFAALTSAWLVTRRFSFTFGA